MSVSFSSFTPNNYPTNARNLVDTNFTTNVALPATATTANTNAFDLQQTTPYPTTESIDVAVLTSASASGNSVNSLVYLQDSADNSTFTNVTTLGTVKVVQGSGSTAATSNYFKLPRGAQRYVRAQVVNPANTANISDATLTLTLLF
jgi:hypothetical protein